MRARRYDINIKRICRSVQLTTMLKGAQIYGASCVLDTANFRSGTNQMYVADFMHIDWVKFTLRKAMKTNAAPNPSVVDPVTSGVQHFPHANVEAIAFYDNDGIALDTSKWTDADYMKWHTYKGTRRADVNKFDNKGIELFIRNPRLLTFVESDPVGASGTNYNAQLIKQGVLNAQTNVKFVGFYFMVRKATTEALFDYELPLELVTEFKYSTWGRVNAGNF